MRFTEKLNISPWLELQKIRKRYILPWSISATGLWNNKKDLDLLSDSIPEVVVGFLLNEPAEIRGLGIKELLEHGHFRTAAVVMSQLVKVNPASVKEIRAKIGNYDTSFFLSPSLRTNMIPLPSQLTAQRYSQHDPCYKQFYEHYADVVFEFIH